MLEYPIKAVIFDMDGTLLDTEGLFVEYWVKAGRACGWPFERRHGLLLRSCAAAVAERTMKQLFGPGYDHASVRATRRKLMEGVLQGPIPAKPGAVEVLTWLKEQGIPTACATASDLPRAQDNLERAGLGGYLQHILSARNVRRGKPYPDVFRSACDQLGLQPEECLVVEDAPNGVIAAFAAGCQVVMVPDQTQPEDCLLSLLTAKVDHLGQIIDLLSE